MPAPLTALDHNRDIAGLKYVYPVFSRRAGGLSIGINLNTNNACNWRCIYCQVPDLTIGAAPIPDLSLLAQELEDFLKQVESGKFYRNFHVPPEQQSIKDIAISGNGEPTSTPHFAEIVELIGNLATRAGIFPRSRFVLITNGSLVHQDKVQDALRTLNRYDGEIWFKLDSATATGRKEINGCAQGTDAALQNLIIAAGICRTALQICLVDIDKRGFLDSERNALLDSLKFLKTHALLDRIMLYTLARPAMQPEAERLDKMPETVMNDFANDLRALGYSVSVSP